MNTKTLLLDLDGTATPHSTWLALNDAMGITLDQDEKLFNQYRNGTLPYHDWIEKLVEIYRKNPPLSRSDLIKLADEIDFQSDTEILVQAAKEMGYHVVLISGSVDVIVERIAERLGVEQWLACSKAVFDGDTFVNISPMGDEGPAKFKLATDAGIKLSKETCITIGDGGNEKELFEHTKGILLGKDKILVPLAEERINSLTEAIELL